MARHANTSFELSLRRAVKRLAKGKFEESIQEVVEHYQDLVDESLAQGKTQEQAATLASRRIGVIGDIARKIVDSPGRSISGKWLQFVGLAFWILVPILFEYSSLYASQLPYPYSLYVGGIVPRSYSTVFVGGLVTAIGWFSSAKIEGKAIAIGSLCLVLMGFRLFVILDYQTGSPNSAEVATRIIFARFLSYIIGLCGGTAMLRLYHYRLDSFKLRRS